jgi:polysaccharide pyruvyl transferase WcaK-like protein
LSQCVPVVGLAYSRKFEGVLRSIEAADLVIDLGTQDRGEAMRRIDAIYAERDGVRARLRQRMPQVKAAVFGLFSNLLAHGNDH